MSYRFTNISRDHTTEYEFYRVNEDEVELEVEAGSVISEESTISNDSTAQETFSTRSSVIAERWELEDDQLSVSNLTVRNKYDDLNLLVDLFYLPGLLYLLYAVAYVFASFYWPYKTILMECMAIRSLQASYYEIAWVGVACPLLLFCLACAKYGEKYLANFNNPGSLSLIFYIMTQLLPRIIYLTASPNLFFMGLHEFDLKFSTVLDSLCFVCLDFSLVYFDHQELIVNKRWLQRSFVLDFAMSALTLGEHIHVVDLHDWEYLMSFLAMFTSVATVYVQLYPFITWIKLWIYHKDAIESAYNRRSIVFIWAISSTNALHSLVSQLLVRIYVIFVAIQAQGNNSQLQTAIVDGSRFCIALILLLCSLLGLLQIVNNIPDQEKTPDAAADLFALDEAVDTVNASE